MNQERIRFPWWQHAAVFVALVAASFIFYGHALDNSFWHAEDFRFLANAKRIAESPAQLFELDAAERHHPLPLAVFAGLYRVFELEPAGYFATNLFVHGINAFLVFGLVLAFLPDRRIALLAGTLFVCGVGSYGKAVLFVGGLENLIITSLYLSIFNLYVRNDRWEDGRIFSIRYVAVLLLFLLVSYAKPTTFSLVMGLLAYKLFFRGERSGRRFWAPNLSILLIGALAFWAARQLGGVVDFSHVMAGRSPWEFAKSYTMNMVNYLIHMFFPIHVSRLVAASHPVVRIVYDLAPLLRVLIGLFAVSYALFGFVFGNRTIRFFLAFTFISLLPYCAIRFPADWLNIRYLYQVSIGFCYVMAAGTVLSMDLLHRRRWRRFLPYVVPLGFVVLSHLIGVRLTWKYEREAEYPITRQYLEAVERGDPNPLDLP